MDRTEQQNLVAQFTERVHQRQNRIADLLTELRQDGRDTARRRGTITPIEIIVP